MRRFTLLLISFCAALFASAQEEIFFDSIPKQHPAGLRPERLVLDPTSGFDETAFPYDFNLLNINSFNQPLIPAYQKNLDFLKYLNPSPSISSSYAINGSVFHPLLPFGQVFNQSAYRLNDRFVVGGNSFGAQSVFDHPQLNPTIHDMSIKGGSMFIEYKVNDRFKVKTRIGISNRGSSPWEP